MYFWLVATARIQNCRICACAMFAHDSRHALVEYLGGLFPCPVELDHLLMTIVVTVTDSHSAFVFQYWDMHGHLLISHKPLLI